MRGGRGGRDGTCQGTTQCPQAQPTLVPLTTTRLRVIAAANGIGAGQTGITQSRTIGLAFQTWVLFMLPQTENKMPYPSQARKKANNNGLPASVIPDHVAALQLFVSGGPFVAKLSASGACFWSKAFDGALEGGGARVAVDRSDSVIVTGVFLGPGTIDLGGGPLAGGAQSNMFLASLSPSGTYGWGKVFGMSGGTIGTAVAVDDGGAIFIGGYLDGSVDFGGSTFTSATGYDVVLASFQADGSYRRAKDFADPEEPGRGAVRIAVDPFSHMFVVGGFWQSLDLGCGPLVDGAEWNAFIASFVR